MSTLLKPLSVREELLKREIRLLTPEVFKKIFHTPSYVTKYFLEKQTKEGLFFRLKKGVYGLKTDPPSEVEIANYLYRPSYISFEYALAYYNILPEAPQVVTSATTKPSRLFFTERINYSYRTIKKEVYTGYFLEKKDGRSFLIAEPEKAFLDHLYFVILRKSSYFERLFINFIEKRHYKTGGLKREKILKYATFYKKKQLIDLLKKIL